MAEGRGLGGGSGRGLGGSSGRGLNSRPRKKDDGFSILRAALTPAEWLINQVSRPAYAVGSLVAGSPVNALREGLAFGTLGASELIPGLDAPETTVSQALTQRGVRYPGGFGGFALRFGTDLITDPASYVTFGATGAVRGAASKAVRGAGERATREAAERGTTGSARNAYVRARERGDMTEARLAMPRQFAVNFAPLGVTLARRGAPLASKDVVLDSSRVGRKVNEALEAVGSSRIGSAATRVFATGGDRAIENRVIDSMVQAVRQQADYIKNSRIAERILRPEGRAVTAAAKAAGIKREDARRSIGAWALTRNDAEKLGISHAEAYAKYVENAAGNGIKTKYLGFDEVSEVFGDRIRWSDGVYRTTGRSEVKNGVKAEGDLIENYVPRIARKGKDQRKVEKIEGWNTPTNALRSATSQQQRVLRTSDDWWRRGLIPEDDYFRLAQWRMFESVDLIAQQTALNAVAAKYGRVLDEAEVLNKFAKRRDSALARAVRAQGIAARARDTAQRSEAEVAARGGRVEDATAAVAGERAAGQRAVAERQRQAGVEEAMQRVFPVDTSRVVATSTRGMDEARRVAGVESQMRRVFPMQADEILSTVPANEATRAAGWTFGEVVAAGSAAALARLARRELATKTDEVERGLASASELTPYARFVERAEQAARDAVRAPKQRARADLQQLRSEARSILNDEKAARRAALSRANQALRAAKRDGNKAAIQRANANVREAKVRLQLAEAKASRRQKELGRAVKAEQKAMDNLATRNERLVEAQGEAARSLKTPGPRASAKEFAEYKEAGWQELQFAHDSVRAVVPPEARQAVDNAFQKAWEITSNQGAFAGVKQFVNSATSRWKGLALISVGYHMRNLQSDLMMAWIAGARDPRSIAQAVQMMRGRKGSIVLNGERMSYDDIVREAVQNGTIRAGEVSADAGRIAQQSEREGRGVFGPPRKPGEGSVAQTSYRFGRFREDATRLMLYVERRKAGDSAEEAAMVVRNYLFDYGDVSRFIASTRRFLLPFITWSAKALPRMVKQAVETPRTFTRIGFLADSANESFGPIDTNTLPIGRTLSFAIPTFGLGSGAYTYNPENVLPYGVLNSFNPFGFKSMGRSAGMFLNPAVRAPIELGTNYNLYQSRTAPRRVQAPVWIRALSGAGVSGGPLDIGPKQDLFTKQEIPGYSRSWDTIFRMFPPYSLAQNYPGVGVESDRIGYLRSVLGVNVSPYERQRDLFYAQRFGPRS
jgi:hypothetical protein